MAASFRASRHVWPALVLLSGLAATAMATWVVWRLVDRDIRARFVHSAEQAHLVVTSRMETHVAVIRASAGLFSASRAVDRDEFAAFVTTLGLRERYPGIQGLGFTSRVMPEGVESLERAMRQQGARDFRIWPEEPTREFHAILYLEPLDRRNEAALGYDMFTDPVRRAAMERARDEGAAAATGQVRLVQEIDDDVQAGFLVYVPVYEGGVVPAAVEDRRRLLRGFTYAPFRIGDLLAGILARETAPEIALEVHDGPVGDDTLMHRSDGWNDASRHRAERSLEVAGRRWTVVYAGAAGLEADAGRRIVAAFGTGGLLATSLVFAAMLAQMRARVAAERASLAERARADELETLKRVGTEVSAQLDLDRLLQSVTDAATRLAGAEIGAFYFRTVEDGGETLSLQAMAGPGAAGFAVGGAGPFGPIALGPSPIRSDDIAPDQPGRRGVRSYLAAPVVSRSGETLGGVVLGHSRPGVFSAGVERLVTGLAAQAAIAVDNARLFGAVRAEAARRKLLLDELNHRVKNTLAAVQSIARQTARSAAKPETFGASFEARLLALSQAHDLLTRGNWEGAALADLIRAELAPYAQGRARICGPRVWLPSQHAVALGMAFHELATNAVKHGALSVPEGQVAIEWFVADAAGDHRTCIVWQESGGPPVVPPGRRGFGSRLLEVGLARELDGTVALEFRPGGLRCIIAFPIAAAVAA